MVALTAGDAAFEPTGDATPYADQSSAVRGAVNFYGVTHLLTRRQTDANGEPTATRKLMAGSLAVFGAADDAAPVLREASPVTHVTARSVPLFTLHGKADTTVDYLQAEELDRVARERGARHRLLLLDGVGHTFDLQKWGKKTLPRDLRPVFLEFLAECVK
jgi:dipeptidyl aminopeptidase/acylaminoacyl peptidase